MVTDETVAVCAPFSLNAQTEGAYLNVRLQDSRVLLGPLCLGCSDHLSHVMTS